MGSWNVSQVAAIFAIITGNLPWTGLLCYIAVLSSALLGRSLCPVYWLGSSDCLLGHPNTSMSHFHPKLGVLHVYIYIYTHQACLSPQTRMMIHHVDHNIPLYNIYIYITIYDCIYNVILTHLHSVAWCMYVFYSVPCTWCTQSHRWLMIDWLILLCGHGRKIIVYMHTNYQKACNCV